MLFGPSGPRLFGSAPQVAREIMFGLNWDCGDLSPKYTRVVLPAGNPPYYTGPTPVANYDDQLNAYWASGQDWIDCNEW